jgi:hypothetical protein
MREIRLSGSEGGGDELNRLSLPLSADPLIFQASLPPLLRCLPNARSAT